MMRPAMLPLLLTLALVTLGCDRPQPPANVVADAVTKDDRPTPMPDQPTGGREQATALTGTTPEPIPPGGGGGGGAPGCPEPGRCYYIGCSFSQGPGSGDGAMLAHYRARHLSSCDCGFTGDGTRATFDKHLREKHAAEAEAVLAAEGKRAEPTAADVASVRLVRVVWQGAVVVARDGSVSAVVPGRSNSTATVRDHRTGRVDPATVFDDARLAAALTATPGSGSGEANEWLCLEAADGWVLRELRGPRTEALGALWDGLYAAGESVGLKR